MTTDKYNKYLIFFLKGCLILLSLSGCQPSNSKNQTPAAKADKPNPSDKTKHKNKPFFAEHVGLPLPTAASTKEEIKGLMDDFNSVCKKANGIGLSKDMTCECPVDDKSIRRTVLIMKNKNVYRLNSHQNSHQERGSLNAKKKALRTYSKEIEKNIIIV